MRLSLVRGAVIAPFTIAWVLLAAGQAFAAGTVDHNAAQNHKVHHGTSTN